MITVVGSLNMDFVVSVDRRPHIGETISSNGLKIFFGGKGGNQAIAAAKQNSTVAFVGAVGDDPYGKNYLKELKAANIQTDYVSVIDSIPTGMAMITIENQDNAIIYSEGANGQLTKDHILKAKDLLSNSQVIIIQFEVSHEVVQTVIELASEARVPVILNPAPFKEFPLEWLEKVTYITPNEQEYEAIISSEFYDEKYDEKFIVTLGKEGASFYDNGIKEKVQAPKVLVKDTTGAGDTFNGVLAHSIANGEALNDAVYKAVHAASLSTTKMGAQSGMPTAEELQTFMEQAQLNGVN